MRMMFKPLISPCQQRDNDSTVDLVRRAHEPGKPTVQS